jgi:hypothetical protein
MFGFFIFHGSIVFASEKITSLELSIHSSITDQESGSPKSRRAIGSPAGKIFEVLEKQAKFEIHEHGSGFRIHLLCTMTTINTNFFPLASIS